MSDSPRTKALLRAIPDEAEALLRELLAEPPAPVDELLALTRAHLAVIAEAARRFEFIPLGMARELAEVSARLIGLFDGFDEEERRLAQAAIRYFIVDDDADSDTSSITGLDDDAAVMNAVLEALGKPEWKVELQ